ncbi:glycerol-3-phosphate dehydrogenase [Varunaivibrio sulfuroxidans]|uniref:Glycerol-3-phosphate dehydrogenase n=1 Tax=Varunaivibrio sulfuroxidans TaxID=1773489 RepID=A0A4V2UP05_9PROT|nr:glycerol-3-phosphate dehydrogenase [Varunaivibrio sulfuroxidans]TCS64001.1 homodimeric glycerol 3-phosphate dehydrogenase (quinone) [Varunaivibrio sulfuroxidans]WES31546.1 glycerol-3-phosphate dehydrogenase [Varunaivibrio sulfuroxidans]
MRDIFDIAIIGGGVNGCGIARDAAGRGLSVCLVEQGDLAGATSSASTKLIHGGLRYLEFYEFRLVREALLEREVLWSMAPHIIHPLRFILPHTKGLRPAWLLRLGLFLYDHLGGRKLLPGTRTIDLVHDPLGAPMKPIARTGFEYSDCAVDDSRLVVLNAIAARQNGAEILTRTRCTRAVVENGMWTLSAEQVPNGAPMTIRAKTLINASGPWVSQFLEHAIGGQTKHRVRTVKGSHIIVKRLFEHNHAYIFQNGDGRIVFAIPYEDDFTLIGTTDEDYQGDPGDVAITPKEIDYLCRVSNDYFKTEITPADVVHSFSGVRPLYDDNASAAHKATRDYVLKIDTIPGRDGVGGAPMLNIFGGKITTYRKLAEQTLAHLGPYLPGMSAPWTAGATLPGGDFPTTAFQSFLDDIRARHPFLPDALALRLARTYGRTVETVLGAADSLADLGHDFGAGLYEAEVRYLIANEWAQTAEDILWRRTKLGLRMSKRQKQGLDAWIGTLAVTSQDIKKDPQPLGTETTTGRALGDVTQT